MTGRPFPASLRFLGALALLWMAVRAPVVIAEFIPGTSAVTVATAATTEIAPASEPHVANMAGIIIPIPPPPPSGPAAPARTKPSSARLAAATIPTPENEQAAAAAPRDRPPPPSKPAPPVLAPQDAGTIAEAAYAALRAGNRRAGAHALDRAIAAGATDPRVDQWRADRALLGRRWSGDAYALLGRGGRGAGLAGAPQLGGSQIGARLGWRLDPLARQPVDVVARAATPVGRTADRGTQAAIGIEWRPLPGLAVAAERAIAIGADARNAWIARVSGGVSGRNLGRGIELDGYAQAGVIGARQRDPFIDGIARLTRPLSLSADGRLKPGFGLWAAAQPDARRLDAGPSIGAEIRVGDMTVGADFDWRWRLAGNARPDSGPAVTIRAGF